MNRKVVFINEEVFASLFNVYYHVLEATTNTPLRWPFRVSYQWILKNITTPPLILARANPATGSAYLNRIWGIFWYSLLSYDSRALTYPNARGIHCCRGFHAHISSCASNCLRAIAVSCPSLLHLFLQGLFALLLDLEYISRPSVSSFLTLGFELVLIFY